MEKMKTDKLLAILTLSIVCFNAYATSPCTNISTPDFSEARIIASNYVNAALCGDYNTMVVLQAAPISNEIESRGGVTYIRGVMSGDFYEMRQALCDGYWPTIIDCQSFVVDNDGWADFGCPKGTTIIRFYFEMRNDDNSEVATGNSNVKIDMIKEKGNWVVFRAK